MIIQTSAVKGNYEVLGGNATGAPIARQNSNSSNASIRSVRVGERGDSQFRQRRPSASGVGLGLLPTIH
jgi:hypothetical protein